jgi:hypothetical protein
MYSNILTRAPAARSNRRHNNDSYYYNHKARRCRAPRGAPFSTKIRYHKVTLSVTNMNFIDYLA